MCVDEPIRKNTQIKGAQHESTTRTQESERNVHLSAHASAARGQRAVYSKVALAGEADSRGRKGVPRKGVFTSVDMRV